MSVNPRKQFMNSLGSFSRDLDSRLSDLEKEVQVSALGRRDKEEGCEASSELLKEAKELLGEIRKSTAEVAEKRADLTSFLDEWRQQFGGIVAEAVKMEDFMGQYGYQPEQPINPDDWDWTQKKQEEDLEEETEVTPAAAAEFPPEDTLGGRTVSAVSNSEETKDEGVRSQVSEPPSVFNIGLSTAGMEFVAGRSLRRAEPSSVLPVVDAGPVSPTPVPTLQQSLMQDESLHAASPFLRCHSKLGQVSDSSLSAADLSSLEITPGLLNKKRNKSTVTTSQAAGGNVTPLSEKTVARVQKLVTDPPVNRDTPELPDLQTIDLGKLMEQQGTKDALPTNLQICEDSGDVPERAPIMNAEKIFDQFRPDVDRRQVLDSPEMPDLKTVDVRRLFLENRSAYKVEVGGEGKEDVPGLPSTGLAPCKTPPKGTPELPEVSSTGFRLSGSPVTPVLHFKY